MHFFKCNITFYYLLVGVRSSQVECCCQWLLGRNLWVGGQNVREDTLLQGVLLKKNMSYEVDAALVAWYLLVQPLTPYFPESTNIGGCGVGAVVPKRQVWSGIKENWEHRADALLSLCSEVLYEDEGFRSRQFAALVASKVFYHLGAFEESLNYALGAGDLFNVNDNSEYVETIIGKQLLLQIKDLVLSKLL